MKDLFGQAIFDYQTNNSPENLITETTISEEDEMSVEYLFRDLAAMPVIEQRALALTKGKTLDVGAGAGSHSLYLQNKRNIDITAIDISPKAVETCQLRGIRNAYVADIMTLESQKYDTILLLMNGTGIFETLKKTPLFLKKLQSLLNPNGQILLDSSDIIYMFDQDEDGAYSIPANGYYGELEFTIRYKGKSEDPFPWLYLDYNTLQNIAIDNNLQCELVTQGDHYDYLARLTLK